MACCVCYSPQGPCTEINNQHSFITIVLPQGFEKHFCVPCSDVGHFNDVMDELDTLTVSMRTSFGQVYVVRVKKMYNGRRARTKMCGGNLHRLISQYSLKGNEKRPTFLTGDASHLDILFNQHYSGLKMTAWVDLNDGFDEMLVQFLYDFLDANGASFAPLFVQRLSTTNIINKLMIINKDVFEELSLPDNGPVKICRRLQEDFCEFSYSFCKDGRMLIRDGWDVFVAKNDLKVWMYVVMAFKMVLGVLTIFVEILDE